MTATGSSRPAGPPTRLRAARTPRVGFLGAGWIGRARLLGLARSGLAVPAMVADPDPRALAAVAEELPELPVARDLDELLGAGLDGIVIATPSASHAEQAVAALEAGVAVFCQKPLGRDRPETERAIAAARAADRLLGVDLCYRHLAATRSVDEVLERGELGEVYAAELTFHNAYGPDKPWFSRRSLSGGGCLIDLGIHLVDLALWTCGAASATVQAARLLRGGRPLGADAEEVEDFVSAQLELEGGVHARLATSWFLHAGRDCVFELALYGTEGAAAVRNVGGSFYDFEAVRRHRTVEERLVSPPDDWGPRAIRAWAARLAAGRGYDPEIERLAVVAGVLDDIYGQGR